MRWVTNSCPLPSCIFSIGRNKVKCVDWNEHTYTRGVANLKPSRPGPIIFFPPTLLLKYDPCKNVATEIELS